MQENDVEREFQIHRTEEDYALAEFWKWALAFLIGVAMGCIGFIVDWGIETLNDFKYYHTVSLIASRGARLEYSNFLPRMHALDRRRACEKSPHICSVKGFFSVHQSHVSSCMLASDIPD